MREEYIQVEDYNRTPLIEAGIGELGHTLCIFIPPAALEIIQWNILVSKKYRMASILSCSSSIDSSRAVVKEELLIQPSLTLWHQAHAPASLLNL